MSENSRRPLSPHIDIYRWQWTAIYSILHRITGIALCFGALLIATWVIVLGVFPDQFNLVHGFLQSPFGILVLVGFCWALFFHLMNGIRHLFWDMGKGLTLEDGQRSAYFVGSGSIILTAAVFVIYLAS